MKKNRLAFIAAAGLAGAIAGTLLPAASPASPPDLTGVWAPAGAAPARGAAGGGAPARGAAGGGSSQPLPLRPEAKRRHDAFNAIVAPTGDTPGGVCLGAGMPGMLQGGGGYPMEVIQRPEQITLIYELHGETRRVYFGDRNAPEQDRVPVRVGYSSGRWEGDVLVVETNNLMEQLDQRSTPHSAEATIVERYRLEGNDAQGRRVLVAEVTMTDPAFYTEPVVLVRRWTQVPNGHLMPYDCNEGIWNDRVETLAEKAGLKLP
ncbi:MAG TPA: hypothetical protein VMK82_09930 [Steroidobacteraceae bacterium]|nr:hypothetical protein [Steroidobacteraceae bacterium]